MSLVLRGGRIWAGKGLPPATALAVRDGRVAAIGGDQAVSGFAGEGTRTVELRGRLVVPGFNDAHVHFLEGGFGLLSVDLRGACDEAELAARLGAQARRLPRERGSPTEAGTTRPGLPAPCPPGGP